MASLVYQNNKHSIDKIYLVLISIGILAPGMGAIDNNAIRWFFLSLISGLYILRLLLKNRGTISTTKLTAATIAGCFLFLLWSSYTSPNPVEGYISLYKLIIIFIVFFSSLNAFKNIDNPLLYLSTIFAYSLFIEAGYTIINYFNEEYLTGIANNRNISSSSIIIKLSFLIYIISKTSKKSLKIFYRMIELISIISIIILQSRLGLASMILIYVIMFSYFKASRKQIFVPALMILLSMLVFNYGNLSSENKNYNILNLTSDESINQRINFYSLALDLFSDKPITGHGLGSWKYESLKYKDPTSSRVLVPYYTHNDFLQILVELGIVGLIIYLLFFRKLLIRLMIRLKDREAKIILLIAIMMLVLNSMLNFPIHRSQEYVPFIIIAALLFSLSQNENTCEMKRIYILSLLLILLIPSSTLAYYEHKSLIVQDKLLADYSSNNFSININELEEINYQIPNIAANVVPISTYLSRYYININNYEKALDLLENSYKANQNDLMTNELLLKVFFFTNRNYAAHKKAKELFFAYYNNENYAELYFSLAIDLNLIEEALSSNVLIKSDNVLVHRIFFEKILNRNILKNSVIKEYLKYSVDKFPKDEYLESLLLKLD